MTLDAFTLSNTNGVELRCIPLGGIIVSLMVPDRHGELADVVLGYDRRDDYIDDTRFVGALIGRYANRIAKGRFAIDDVSYHVTINDGVNHLHGGRWGFHKAVWAAEPFRASEGTAVRFHHSSPEGDEGYPGTLDTTVTYTLTDDNALIVDYRASTDRPTLVNLTQHAYFNLTGHDGGDILGHELELNASRFTPVDRTLIPTGELRDVRGTPFDFTTALPIGSRIHADDEQLRFGNGYDHNFVINRGRAAFDEPVLAARLVAPASGRMLELSTTEPGLQVYSGNGFDERFVGRNGRVYRQYAALALEPQHFPDSPNRPEFPSTILRPGETYRSRSIYRFGVV